MFRHFIVYSELDGVAFAYHFSTSDRTGQEIGKAWARLQAHTTVQGDAYAIHVLGTDSPTFTSVQDMDPYFANVKEITDLAEFFSYLEPATPAQP